MFKIALTNLGKYNEGELVYKWLELPATDEEIDEAKAEIGINDEYEEWFITDYETSWNLRIGEYENLDNLNETAEMLENLDSYEAEIVAGLLENGYTVEQAIDCKDDCRIFYNCYSMRDVAEEWIDEVGMLSELPEWARNYFDFEAYGRDMEFESEFHYLGNGKYLEVMR